MRILTRHARKRIAPIVAACLISSASLAQDAIAPKYTSLQDCDAVKQLKLPNRLLTQRAGAGVFRCKGVAGYAVYVVDDDPRSFLVLERRKKLFSLEKPMVEEFSLGNFPNVTGAKKAEWRIDARGNAVALISRVAYQKADSAKAASTLLVFDLRNGEPVLIGAATTNEEARQLADGGSGAQQEDARARDCNAIYASLCRDFPPGPEQLGRCYDRRPAIADKVPAECIADFQTNIENYHQAVGEAK